MLEAKYLGFSIRKSFLEYAAMFYAIDQNCELFRNVLWNKRNQGPGLVSI